MSFFIEIFLYEDKRMEYFVVYNMQFIYFYRLIIFKIIIGNYGNLVIIMCNEY